MKDEYVSVEHIFLSLLEHANQGLREVFRTFESTKTNSSPPSPLSAATRA